MNCAIFINKFFTIQCPLENVGTVLVSEKKTPTYASCNKNDDTIPY
jgi:hypothetical protein